MSGTVILKKIEKAAEEKKPFYSFEFFPPKVPEGIINLFSRLERMAALEPAFIDVTWGAGGSTADSTLEISTNAQQYIGLDVMMHLTCTNMPRDKVKSALEIAKKAGIRNILALRGDPPKGADTWEKCENGFAYAVDLVKFIRAEYGDWFGIAVAGYPEGHIEAKSIDEDIAHLKAKVDAGADFIITQLFYDVELFLKWVEKCRAAGIKCPIIPGIMPIQTYSGFKRMTTFCKTYVPKEITDALEPIQDDDAAVKAYGIELGYQMSRRLLEAGIPGLHFYTLNLERSVICILEKLKFVSSPQSGQLPWVQSQVARRSKEDVRPIFWANRPRSYLDRTATWDEFPNGRLGNISSPAFGDLLDYHLCNMKTGSVDDRKTIWGSAPQKTQDVYDVFAKFIEGGVSRLPWCENKLNLETTPLKASLVKINKSGFLTVNSQPRVNGVDSSDPAVGWGGPGGYVYQKAYLEFFCSPQSFERLEKALAEFPALTYMATNVKGQPQGNMPKGERVINAVTWGVFPNKEITQPTVVDSESFQYWKDEAFALWKSQWQTIYEEGSASWELIQSIHDNYLLVNIVDNDFVKGDIFKVFERLFA